MSRQPRRWLRVRWPHEVTEDFKRDGLRALNGLSTPRRRDAIQLVAVGRAGAVSHFMTVPGERAVAVTERLRHAIPGLVVEEVEALNLEGHHQWHVWMSTRRRPLALDASAALSGGIITALAGTHQGETLALTWTLGPVRRPIATPTKANTSHADSWQHYIPIGITDLDTNARSALAKKQGVGGWRAAGVLTVQTSTRTRELQLLLRLAAALRGAQGAGVQLGAHRPFIRPRPAMPFRRSLALNIEELLGLSAWPEGDLDRLPIDRMDSRVVAPVAAVPRQGFVLGTSTHPGSERPIAIGTRSALSHGWLCAPTGAGKTTLLSSLYQQIAAAGHSVAVIDPKGDLCETALSLTPPSRRDEVVVLDVADDGYPVVGLNPLHSREQPELVADRLLYLFRSLSGPQNFGPRLGDVLHAILLLAAQLPVANLCVLPALLADAGVRRRSLKHIDDPWGLTPWFATFDRLSESERQQTIAPVQRRLNQLLLRPRMRAVLGQSRPKFDIADFFVKPHILLVNLAKGVVGPEASSLMGSLVVSQLWQAALGRAAIAPERRTPCYLLVDELQDTVHGITDVADVLSQARGLSVGFFAAHQNLAQLDGPMRAALANNARGVRVVFQTSADDAAFFARGQNVLRPEDFQRLPAYHAYVSLLAAGQVTPYASIRTELPGKATSDPADIRARSRARYGIDREATEAELTALLSPQGGSDAAIGVRRRKS